MSQYLGQKRSALEPATRLLGQDLDLPADAKRPITVTIGAVFVGIRALGGVLWVLSLWLLWDELAESLEFDPVQTLPVLWVLTGAGMIVMIALAVFTWLIWRGNNFARVVTMCVLTLSIVTAAVQYFAEGAEITLQTTLLNLAIDILVLLALSSREARSWSRRPRSTR